MNACVTGPLGLNEWKTKHEICLTCLAEDKMVERDVRQGLGRILSGPKDHQGGPESKQRAPGNLSGDCRRIGVVYLHPPRNKHPWPKALVRGTRKIRGRLSSTWLAMGVSPEAVEWTRIGTWGVMGDMNKYRTTNRLAGCACSVHHAPTVIACAGR